MNSAATCLKLRGNPKGSFSGRVRIMQVLNFGSLNSAMRRILSFMPQGNRLLQNEDRSGSVFYQLRLSRPSCLPVMISRDF